METGVASSAEDKDGDASCAFVLVRIAADAAAEGSEVSGRLTRRLQVAAQTTPSGALASSCLQRQNK